MIWGGVCPSSEESRRAQRSRIDRPPQAARASAARVLDGEQGRDTCGDLTPRRCPFVPVLPVWRYFAPRDGKLAQLRRSAESSPTALPRSAPHKIPISAIETIVSPITK